MRKNLIMNIKNSLISFKKWSGVMKADLKFD